MLQKAIAIWRESDQSDYLEGIEKDPVLLLHWHIRQMKLRLRLSR